MTVRGPHCISDYIGLHTREEILRTESHRWECFGKADYMDMACACCDFYGDCGKSKESVKYAEGSYRPYTNDERIIDNQKEAVMSRFFRNCSSKTEWVMKQEVLPGNFIRVPDDGMPSSGSFVEVVDRKWCGVLDECWESASGDVIGFGVFEEEYFDTYDECLFVSDRLRMRNGSKKRKGSKKKVDGRNGEATDREYPLGEAEASALVAFDRVQKLLNDKVPQLQQQNRGDVVETVKMLLNGYVNAVQACRSMEADLKGMQAADGTERDEMLDGTMFSREQSRGVIRRVRKMRTPCDDQSGEDVCADAEPCGSWRP